MLEIQSLTKTFGLFVAVDALTFQVHGGEIVGLLGPNGAGKTTTIRCLTSILQPTSGRITLDGYDIVTHPEEAKRTLAYIPEVPSPYNMLTVGEHLRFVAAAYGAEMDKAYAEELLKRLDLWEKRNELGANLSKGMKQKLACACAFIHRPKIYFFDEPLIGIDPKGAHELKNMLAEQRAEGHAVLVSTHMLDTAERLCDRVIIMNRGRVVEQGTMAELHARVQMGDSSTGENATLEAMFLRLTEEAG